MFRYRLSIRPIVAALAFAVSLSAHGQELSAPEREAAFAPTLSKTIVTLKSSAQSVGLGERFMLKARVTGSAGTPFGGKVQFKSGNHDLGEAAVSSDGTASLEVRDLKEGTHLLTAVYSGNRIYSSSTSEAITQVIVQRSWKEALLVIAFVLIAALFLLAFRYIFRFLLRILNLIGRILAKIIKPILGILRRFRLIFPAKDKPASGITGIAIGSLASAMTETDEALEKAFKQQQEGQSDTLFEKQQELFFYSLLPKNKERGRYTPDKIPRDYERTKSFFSTVVDNKVNPINLYDDINNAFIVKVFGQSDYRCFRVLTEFKNIINSNVTKLAIFISTLISLYVLSNVLLSGSVDVFEWVGKDGQNYISRVAENSKILFEASDIDIRIFINKFVFGLFTFIVFYLAIAIVHSMGYQKEQRINASRMQTFLNSYMAELAIRFGRLKNDATRAVTEIAKKDSQSQFANDTSQANDTDKKISAAASGVQFIEMLHWTALRVLFIQMFIKNIVFQINRNYSYVVIFIPLFFLIAASLGFMWLVPDNFYEIHVYPRLFYHSTFYIGIPLLVWSGISKLRTCIFPIHEIVEDQDWTTFDSLEVVTAMTEIMAAYENQLEQWRSRGQFGTQ